MGIKMRGNKNKDGGKVTEGIKKEILEGLKQKHEEIKLHMGLAEQGKIYALSGNHNMALTYYRQAIYMTVKEKDPEVFFRHYLECVMESLEHTGSYEEVLAYCDKAVEFYEDNPPPNPLAQIDLAHIYLRKGVALMKIGEKEEAMDALQQGMDVAKKVDQPLPLGQTLLRWLKTGMNVDVRRLLEEQKRHEYFSVRTDTVNRKMAVKLPDERIFGAPII